MLSCKYFGRRHHSRLISVFDNGINKACRNGGFAGADITLNKAVAGKFAFHISHTFADCTLLRIGESER